WGVPVIEEYGSTETGSLAGECPEGRLHLWADRMLFEVRDPGTGRASAEGNGHLVVTPLLREAMPLVRYDLEDDVEVSYADCACGWLLPTVRVLGRSAYANQVNGRKVTQPQLEDLVFGLHQRFEVLFWRARAEPERLLIQIEVGAAFAAEATATLTAAVRAAVGVTCEVTPVPPGTLVPDRVLTGVHDVVKPRSLFGPDEDWDKALLYY
ncbi:MAG TPA: phenylacetate--CoA ligase family protein, partial [Streptosporangiaceae bacterium]|nr:phenylacetate--CoA ligase family protein [Streptosporangiaceae bacterium]